MRRQGLGTSSNSVPSDANESTDATKAGIGAGPAFRLKKACKRPEAEGVAVTSLSIAGETWLLDALAGPEAEAWLDVLAGPETEGWLDEAVADALAVMPFAATAEAGDVWF